VKEFVRVRVWLYSYKQLSFVVKIRCSQLDTEIEVPATTVQRAEENGTENLKQFEKTGQVARNSKYGRYQSGFFFSIFILCIFVLMFILVKKPTNSLNFSSLLFYSAAPTCFDTCVS
jgi:hypothetical protein